MPWYHPPKRRPYPRYNRETQRLYCTKRWLHTRQSVLAESPLCEDCAAIGVVTPATDVHHRVKHYGHVDRFFDRRILGTLCTACHSRRTQRGE